MSLRNTDKIVCADILMLVCYLAVDRVLFTILDPSNRNRSLLNVESLVNSHYTDALVRPAPFMTQHHSNNCFMNHQNIFIRTTIIYSSLMYRKEYQRI